MDWKPEARIIIEANKVKVYVYWSGPEPLDRPSTGGWSFLLEDKALAERLTKAINDGMVYTNPTVMKDFYGKSYVVGTRLINTTGRHLKKSLKTIGY